MAHSVRAPAPASPNVSAPTRRKMPQTISSIPNRTASTISVGPGQARARTPATMEITPKMAGHHQDRPTRVTCSPMSVPPPKLRNPIRFTTITLRARASEH